MTNPNSPHNILAAVIRIEAELPALIGPEGWQAVGEKLQTTITALRQCRDADQQRTLSDDITDLLWEYPAANRRLHTELGLQGAIQQHMIGELVAISAQLQLGDAPTGTLFAAAHSVTAWTREDNAPLQQTDLSRLGVTARGLVIAPGGLGGGKSIKFGNLHLDLGEMSEIAAGAMLAGVDMIDKPHVLVIVAGALLTVRALTKAMTVEISEREASVFWGMVQARDPETNLASEDVILVQTNQERERYGLAPLEAPSFRNALVRLEQLKTIQQVPDRSGMWLIVESYQIED